MVGGFSLVRAALVALVVVAPAGFALIPAQVESASNFLLVGHHPLHHRGMNAALAVYEDPATGKSFAYVGSRTDGSPHHPHAGVLVLDVTDPRTPTLVNEIGGPREGNVGETSREMQVWPAQKLLLVMNFGCSALLHACTSGADAVGSLDANVAFFDLSDPAFPSLVATYRPSRTPHEMFLWEDPEHAGRALLYMSTPTSSSRADRPNVLVTDISGARAGAFTELLAWNPNPEFPSADRNATDVRLHSLSLNPSGTRAYFAYLGGGFLVADTSEFTDPANAAPRMRFVTDVGARTHWGDPGAHSAVKVPGKPYALVTDEVYGDLIDPITGFTHGCPWGWVRLVDIGASASEATPAVVSEYRIAQNEASYCQGAQGQDPLNTLATSYSAHNPTVVGDLALVTWHSGGLQAISLADPTAPSQAGHYAPEPLPYVVTEDPALSAGRDKVVMWSYPVVKDGLVYVVDLRNGLYVLRYTGPHAASLAAVDFLVGNSNVGDAAALEAAS